MSETEEITRLLNEAQDGREGALDEVMELVYGRLRALAAAQYRRRGKSPTLQPTELVHEAFLKLVKQRNRYDSRGHFFAIASKVMLRVLLDQQRARGRLKRGGEHLRVTLGDALEPGSPEEPSMVVPAFVEALERLEALDERSAEVTKLRLLWGLTVPEIAETMDVSVSTVEREWRFARRWLATRLGEGSEP